MQEHYGEGSCSLDYRDPFTLTLAVVLSAQCTDAAVNRVTPALFDHYGTPALLAQASTDDIETCIHSLGFFRTKSRNLIGLSRKIMEDYGGELPHDFIKLQTLPGVGRKTANVVMCEAFHDAQGIAVDTHVFRIAHRLRLAGPSADTPGKTEKALLKVYPHHYWLFINHQWVHFGRDFCCARHPHCDTCFIHDLCPEGNRLKDQWTDIH
jgi:endonuclease-3